MYNIDKVTKLLDHANDYSSLGLHTFPCKGKAPLTKHGCKDASKAPDQLEQWFKNRDNINIACATGEPSGVFVIDVDDLHSLESYELIHGKLPVTWLSQTPSGGYHYWFRATDRTNKLKNAVKFFGSLDIRTSGGYALLPPSVGDNGKPYVWIMPPHKTELADCPLAWIESMPSHDVEPSKSESESLTIQRARTMQERCILYLDTIPPAISGSGGMNATFRLCCYLVENFGNDLDNEELLHCLEQWNSKCLPPWTEKELRRKLQDARTKTQPKIQTSQTPKTEQSVKSRDLSLSEDAYVGILGDIVRAIEPETEADVAGVLLSLLVGVGSIVGKSPTMQVTGDIHFTNLYLALVGDTASGKGQAWGVARYILSRIDPTWSSQDIANGLSSGEGLVERVQDPKPKTKQDQETDQDQALTFTLPPEKRLLCLETEFSKPIAAMRREGSTLSATLRSAWDGYPLEVMTRGQSKLRAGNAHISIIAHVTPKELNKLLGDSVETSNGFTNRFLWASVSSSKDLPFGGSMDVVNEFIPELRANIDRARAVKSMSRSSEAVALWESVYPLLKHGQEQVTERARAQALRLSMVYALSEGQAMIDTRHLLGALAVWKYCEESALALFCNNSLAIKLRAMVRAKPGIMRNELRQSVSHSISTETFDKALEWSEKRKDIVCVECYEERQCSRYYPCQNFTQTNKNKDRETELNNSQALTLTHTNKQEHTQSNKPTSLNPNIPAYCTVSVQDDGDDLNSDRPQWLKDALAKAPWIKL